MAKFGGELGAVRTALDDLRANFGTLDAQGPQAYADQMTIDHPDLHRAALLADAVLAVETFHTRLSER